MAVLIEAYPLPAFPRAASAPVGGPTYWRGVGFTDDDGGASDPEAAADFDPGFSASQPTLEDAIGVPARTFAQRARDHADDFQ